MSGPVISNLRWVVAAALPVTLSGGVVLLTLLPGALAPDARWALGVLGVLVVLWSTTRLPAGHLALVGALVLVLAGVIPEAHLFEGLSSEIVWLMIGAFVLAAALQETHVASHATRLLLGRARTVGGALYWLTLTVIPLALVIPSTTARATMALPAHLELAALARDRKVTRASALLVPNVVLMSSVMTILAAGSHVIAVDVLERSTGRTIDFVTWALLAIPLGVLSSFAVAFFVSRMFLDARTRARSLRWPVRRTSLGPRGWRAAIAMAVMLGLWSTSRWHGASTATVTIAGAVALTAPGLGVLSWNKALSAVSWNLILFLGAIVAITRALDDTGAAAWAIEHLIPSFDAARGELPVVLLLLLATTTAHLYIPSHAARAAALIPIFLLGAKAAGLDPVAVTFIATMGLDYCSTLPVSSKSTMLFHQLEGEPFQTADLLRLSAALLPVYVLLVVALYYAYWRDLGVSLGVGS